MKLFISAIFVVVLFILTSFYFSNQSFAANCEGGTCSSDKYECSNNKIRAKQGNKEYMDNGDCTTLGQVCTSNSNVISCTTISDYCSSFNKNLSSCDFDYCRKYQGFPYAPYKESPQCRPKEGLTTICGGSYPGTPSNYCYGSQLCYASDGNLFCADTHYLGQGKPCDSNDYCSSSLFCDKSKPPNNLDVKKGTCQQCYAGACDDSNAPPPKSGGDGGGNSDSGPTCASLVGSDPMGTVINAMCASSKPSGGNWFDTTSILKCTGGQTCWVQTPSNTTIRTDCHYHSDCPDGFCISYGKGTTMGSSCMPAGSINGGSCESFPVRGSAINQVCKDGTTCNASTLRCTPPDGAPPGVGGPVQNAPGTNRMSDVGYCADGQRNSSDQSKAIPVNNPKCTLNEATSPNSTNAYCLQQSQLKYQNGSAAYFYTCPTTPGGNSGTSSNCSSIILKTVGGASMCNTKPGCYISTNGEFTYPTCKADEDKGVPCGQLDGVQSYCNNSQTCIKNSPYVSCRDNGTVQPGGDANNSCKALNLDGSVKADNSVCASGVCNATTYTCDPIKNPGTTTDTTPCASHKGISSYVNGTCDHQLFNAADYTAGKFCSTKAYYDRYICMDGTTIDFPVPASDHVCHETAWCPIGGGTGPAPVCRADCAAMKDPNGNPYSCTPDYNSTGSTTGTNSCCPDGKRFCSIAGSCVSATQGCGGLLAGIGQTCGDTNQCADAAAGAKCLPFGSSKACQWPGGTPPTPTAGASTNCSTLGRYGAGCGCSNGSGCGYDSNGSPLGCYAAIDNPNELYCAPVGQRWCTKSHTVQSNLEACNGSMAFITPTPTPNLGYLNDCPGPIYPSAPGGNQCQAGPTCTSGFSHNTKIGPGGTTGDQACSAAGIGNICCTHDTSSPATGGSAGGTAGGSTGSTTPTDAPGCPSDNINTCSDTACAPGKQNNGVGADAACQNINPATGKAYGQYCCKK